MLKFNFTLWSTLRIDCSAGSTATRFYFYIVHTGNEERTYETRWMNALAESSSYHKQDQPQTGTTTYHRLTANLKRSDYIIVFAATTNSNTSITAHDEFSFMPQWAPSGSDYPERSVCKSTAAKVCSTIFNGSKNFKVRFGFKSKYCNLKSLTSTVEKNAILSISFKIMKKDTKWLGQIIDEKQCVGTFTNMWQGPENNEYNSLEVEEWRTRESGVDSILGG